MKYLPEDKFEPFSLPFRRKQYRVGSSSESKGVPSPGETEDGTERTLLIQKMDHDHIHRRGGDQDRIRKEHKQEE